MPVMEAPKKCGILDGYDITEGRMCLPQSQPVVGHSLHVSVCTCAGPTSYRKQWRCREMH